MTDYAVQQLKSQAWAVIKQHGLEGWSPLQFEIRASELLVLLRSRYRKTVRGRGETFLEACEHACQRARKSDIEVWHAISVGGAKNHDEERPRFRLC